MRDYERYYLAMVEQKYREWVAKHVPPGVTISIGYFIHVLGEGENDAARSWKERHPMSSEYSEMLRLLKEMPSMRQLLGETLSGGDMRVNESDWDDIRERVKEGDVPNIFVPEPWHISTFLASSLNRLEEYKDNPLVQGLIRFIEGNANAPLTDVTSWNIEATESDEKAFIVALVDGRKYIGTLVPSYVIEGRWVCNAFKPERFTDEREEQLRKMRERHRQ